MSYWKPTELLDVVANRLFVTGSLWTLKPNRMVLYEDNKGRAIVGFRIKQPTSPLLKRAFR